MPTTASARRARGEHRVERRRAAVRRAVAHAGRHADHRPARETADEARERAVHPRDHDDAVGPLDVGQRRRESVHAGDTDVLVDDDCRAEELRADPHLAYDGAVRGSRRDHGDDAPRLGNAACDPDAARERVLLDFGHGLADGGPRGVVCARREHASRAAFEKCHEDLRDLLRGLPLGENDLGRTLPKLPMKVDPREPEIAVRQLGEPLQRVVGARRPGPHTFEKVAEIVAEPGHRAIVR